MLNDWHAIGFPSDYLPETIYKARLLGRDLVIWRDKAGTLHAWEDLCIHRGARLSAGFISNDQLVCPYHGWHYDGSGKCVLIPAAPDEAPLKKAAAFTHSVLERYGFVWVCLGAPASDIPVFPEWENAEFLKVHSGPYVFAANAFRSVENFVDISHFPFVHAGLNATPGSTAKLNSYTVEMTGTGLKTSEISTFQPAGDARGVPIMSHYTYSCFGPLVAHFQKRTQDANETGQVISQHCDYFTTYCTVQMVDETHCILRVCAALSVKPAPEPEQVRKRADVIYLQDKDIVETQRPQKIPTDLRYELHHRTDLLGQRYRTWLRDLGITYGVV